MKELPPERNQPCAQGRALGAQIARLTKPDPAMCASCAYRLGTYPNRCLETVVAAARCVIEEAPFYCHVHKAADGSDAICAGFLSAINNPDWAPILTCPNN